MTKKKGPNESRKTTKKVKAGLAFKQLKLKLKMVKFKSYKIDSNKIVQKEKDKKQLSKLDLVCK